MKIEQDRQPLIIIVGAVALMVGVFLGGHGGVSTTKHAMTKTECARYNPTSGVIELKKNGAWQPFDTY